MHLFPASQYPYNPSYCINSSGSRRAAIGHIQSDSHDALTLPPCEFCSSALAVEVESPSPPPRCRRVVMLTDSRGIQRAKLVGFDAWSVVIGEWMMEQLPMQNRRFRHRDVFFSWAFRAVARLHGANAVPSFNPKWMRPRQKRGRRDQRTIIEAERLIIVLLLIACVHGFYFLINLKNKRKKGWLQDTQKFNPDWFLGRSYRSLLYVDTHCFEKLCRLSRIVIH